MPQYPNTIAVEVPKGVKGDVRASLALSLYGRIIFDDLKIKKSEDPENIRSQQRRIAQAIAQLAEVQDKPAPLHISLNCPDEKKGAYAEEFQQVVRAAFPNYEPEITFRAKYYNLEPLNLALQYARERGNWDELLTDEVIYINTLSNGNQSITNIMSVRPRRIVWKSEAADSGSPLVTSFQHLRDLLPELTVNSRVAIWSNTDDMRQLLAGETISVPKGVKSIAVAVRNLREQRKIEFTLPKQNDHLENLSHLLTYRAYKRFLKGKLQTPLQKGSEVQSDRAQ